MAGEMTPPGVQLTAGKETVSGELGSYVWRGRAVDHALTVPEQAVTVAPSETLRFQAAGRTPDEVFLSVYVAGETAHAELTPVTEQELDPTSLTWPADLEPGNYVVTLFRAWEGNGDVTHYFHLRVHP